MRNGLAFESDEKKALEEYIKILKTHKQNLEMFLNS
jgi:hypothetical protein